MTICLKPSCVNLIMHMGAIDNHPVAFASACMYARPTACTQLHPNTTVWSLLLAHVKLASEMPVCSQAGQWQACLRCFPPGANILRTRHGPCPAACPSMCGTLRHDTSLISQVHDAHWAAQGCHAALVMLSHSQVFLYHHHS
jgi:hypothetical protein